MPDRSSETAQRTPVTSDRVPAQATAAVALKSAAVRLAEILDRETSALKSRQPFDLDDLCNRKNQSLLELSRITRQIDREALDPEIMPLLGTLREKLDENKAALKLHLEAAGEVAEILTAALRDAESDGTYSNSVEAGLDR